jgi:UPF0716 protein FxsA
MNYFVLFFIFFPILEIVLLIKVGGHIGVLNTVLLILGTGVAGAAMARLQGFLILQKISENLNRGIMPSQEILDGAMVLAGAVCLLDPGIIGDILGVILLVPWTRALIRKAVVFLLQKKFDRGEVITVKAFRSYNDNDELPR